MNNSRKRRLSTPLLVGVICAVLAGAYVVYLFSVSRTRQPATSAVGPPPTTVPVRIGSFSTAIDYAPLIVAQANHWLDAELGLPAGKVEYVTLQTLPSINEGFASDRLDVVFEAEVPAIVGRAAGIDIRIVGVGATLTEGILVRTTAPVKAVSDLKGKSVAVLSGTAMHFGLVNLLKSAGVNPADVKLLNMVPPDAAAAFASGQIDAWAVWPPWPEQQVVAKTGRFLPNAQAQVQSVIVMRQAFIRDQRVRADAIMRAIAKAKTWLSQNESAGVALIAQQLKLPEDVVRLAWPKHNWLASLDDAISEDIEGKAAFLLDQKMIQQPVSAVKIIERLEGTR